jgi:hypothetical protein
MKKVVIAKFVRLLVVKTLICAYKCWMLYNDSTVVYLATVNRRFSKSSPATLLSRSLCGGIIRNVPNKHVGRAYTCITNIIITEKHARAWHDSITMSSVMESSTITSDSSFTASFTTTERSSSTHWKQLQQQQQQGQQQQGQRSEDPPSGPHHSSDDYYNASAQHQQYPRTTNIMKERAPEFVNEVIGVVGSSSGGKALEALQIVGDVPVGSSTNNNDEEAVLYAIPEAHNVTHKVNETQYAPTEITQQPHPQPQPQQELLLVEGERKHDIQHLHYKKAGDEESAWAGPEEESKQPSVLPIPDDRSQSGNSWFMPGYTFRDQAPRARNVHLYYKQEPPTTELLGHKSSVDFSKQKDTLPNNLNPVASFTSWVPTPYLVKPQKPNPEPARFTHRQPLEEDPWVVPMPPPEKEQILVETVISDDETGDEFFEDEMLEENDISTFADEEFSDTGYNDYYVDSFIDEEAPPQPPLQPIVPPPLLPENLLEKSKISWSAAEYGGWDNNSSSSESKDDSSAQYDRSLSWDGFSPESSRPKKTVRKGKRDQAVAPIPEHLSIDDGIHPSDLSLTPSRHSAEQNIGPPEPVAPFAFDRDSSSSSGSSSSSSSLPSPPHSSSSSDSFQDEYIIQSSQEEEEEEEKQDEKWYPSYRTLALLVLANLLVLTGIIVGVVLLVQRNKRMEEEEDNSSTTPPVTQQAQTNIFSNIQSMPGTR